MFSSGDPFDSDLGLEAQVMADFADIMRRIAIAAFVLLGIGLLIEVGSAALELVVFR